MKFFLLLSLALSVNGQLYDYTDALGKSILFYDSERSGPLPEDNRVDYRYDSTVDDEIVGGYFDGQ